MKILVVADIHSNWPALAAIDETFDVCLCLGDIVEYGTDPLPCIDWIRANAQHVVRGNHDHAVAQRVPPRTGHGFRDLAAATREVHWRVLDRSRAKWLARLPVTRRIELDGRRFHLVHATPRDPMDEYVLADAEAWAHRTAGLETDVLCVGHTHVPFHLDLGRVRVLNPGSVGQPRDGDPRCSYAVIENGRVELRRVPYDIEATVQNLRESGLSREMVDLAEHVLRTGGELPAGAARPPDRA